MPHSVHILTGGACRASGVRCVFSSHASAGYCVRAKKGSGARLVARSRHSRKPRARGAAAYTGGAGRDADASRGVTWKRPAVPARRFLAGSRASLPVPSPKPSCRSTDRKGLLRSYPAFRRKRHPELSGRSRPGVSSGERSYPLVSGPTMRRSSATPIAGAGSLTRRKPRLSGGAMPAAQPPLLPSRRKFDM